MNEITQKYQHLTELLRSYRRLAVAFSGGTDSAFLLAAAQDALGKDLLALTAESAQFPQRECESAARLCESRNIRLICFPAPSLQSDAFCANPPERCYICKKALFSQMKQFAVENGFSVLADGTNADDPADYRPGLQALSELGVVSPLLEVGLTKTEIRQLSRSMGLPTWDQPSAACLASRIPYGERITAEKLRMIGEAEQYLAALGCGQLRVRMHSTLARIEVLPEYLPQILAHRQQISEALKSLGFTYVTLDLDGYRTGSLNETLKNITSAESQ
ncbi:MAG: ATP-dependent sacrificial sulfur transferase LarE [Oscillospiraceae bacterium]|nr:ATP-dependent sacrificial sulfur transferase LarE [Oscillospiraceae bacterium]